MHDFSPSFSEWRCRGRTEKARLGRGRSEKTSPSQRKNGVVSKVRGKKKHRRGIKSRGEKANGGNHCYATNKTSLSKNLTERRLRYGLVFQSLRGGVERAADEEATHSEMKFAPPPRREFTPLGIATGAPTDFSKPQGKRAKKNKIE